MRRQEGSPHPAPLLPTPFIGKGLPDAASWAAGLTPSSRGEGKGRPGEKSTPVTSGLHPAPTADSLQPGTPPTGRSPGLLTPGPHLWLPGTPCSPRGRTTQLWSPVPSPQEAGCYTSVTYGARAPDAQGACSLVQAGEAQGSCLPPSPGLPGTLQTPNALELRAVTGGGGRALLWPREEGKKASSKPGTSSRQAQPPPGCLLNIFLTSCLGLPGPGLGAPACPSPCWGREQRPEMGGGGESMTPPPLLIGRFELCTPLPQRHRRVLSFLGGGVAYRGSALGRGGHKFRRSPGQGHPVRAGGKPGPSPHPMAATVGEKTSQGQVVRCWGRQGGRGSGVTRPSWHRGGACTPPPRATREAQTIRGSPRVSPRAARSLGVATACSPPGLGGRVVGAYLGLGQTFQGLHNRLLGPRGLGLQREGRRAPSVWAEPGVGGLRVGGGRAGEPRGAGWPGGGSRPGGRPSHLP